MSLLSSPEQLTLPLCMGWDVLPEKYAVQAKKKKKKKSNSKAIGIVYDEVTCLELLYQ